jgi:hypothetical protein
MYHPVTFLHQPEGHGALRSCAVITALSTHRTPSFHAECFAFSPDLSGSGRSHAHASSHIRRRFVKGGLPSSVHLDFVVDRPKWPIQICCLYHFRQSRLSVVKQYHASLGATEGIAGSIHRVTTLCWGQLALRRGRNPPDLSFQLSPSSWSPQFNLTTRCRARSVFPASC